MSHLARDKDRLIKRVRRIRGQIEGVERALTEERECADILQTIAAAKGAIDGLMAEVLESQVREHLIPPGRRHGEAHLRETEELVAVLRRYLK
jgi:DNA-binding FrmR family transcriptional regulator